jgi:flavin reductase (DIM6/NTAB) family NADH-FMN oxidoreductase RutF
MAGMSSTPRRIFRFDDPDVRGYPLLTSLVVPRPIAWVSSLSASGVGNLAPHSFFTVACADPGIVQFTSIGAKDTLRNVRETEEFVVNVAPRWMLHEINNSSARFDADTFEAEALDIAMEPSDLVAPLRVAGSPASLECRLHSTIDLGTSTVVLGTVLAATVREDVLDGVHPTMAGLEPLSRLGRNQWGLPPEVIAIDRPQRPEDVRG